MATVVEQFTTFWLNVTSDVVEVTQSDTMFSTTTVASTSQVSPEEAGFYAGCGSTKGCYGVPDASCVNDLTCTALVTYQVVGSNVSFQVSGVTTGYVAVGLSSDQQMGGDSVVQCVYTSDSVAAAHSQNVGFSNQPLTDPNYGITFVTGSYVNGKVLCEYSQLGAQSVNSLSYNLLTDTYFLLVAIGSASSTTIIQPHALNSMWASGSSTTLDSTDIIGASASKRYLIVIHGICMLGAWVMTVSIAVFIARYYKPVWPNSTLCGQKVWFSLHRSLNTACILFTCVAFVVIFVYVDGWAAVYKKKSPPHSWCNCYWICAGTVTDGSI